MRTYELELPITLTEAEVAERGRSLAKVALEAAQREAEIADIKKDTKERTDVLKDDVIALRRRTQELARAVRKGVEIGPVSVRAVVAEDNSKVDVIRQDTGEVVNVRPMSEEDRQMQLEDVLDRVEEETKKVEREDLLDDLDGDDDQALLEAEADEDGL